MDGLILEIVYFDDPNDPTAPNWRIQVANTPDSFLFRGATADEQQMEIITFANMMREYDVYPDGLAEMLPHMIDIPDGMNASDMMDILFDGTTSLMYRDAEVYAVPEGGGALIDFLAEAGDELWEAILLAL